MRPSCATNFIRSTDLFSFSRPSGTPDDGPLRALIIWKSLEDSVWIRARHLHRQAYQATVRPQLAGWGGKFRPVAFWDQSASLYQKNSEINQLNTNGVLKKPSPHFRHFVSMALFHARQTQGKFDPTIGLFLQRIKSSFKETGSPPSAMELDKIRSQTGYQKVHLNESRIQFLAPKLEISLDGIVKGMAIDLITLIFLV